MRAVAAGMSHAGFDGITVNTNASVFDACSTGNPPTFVVWSRQVFSKERRLGVFRILTVGGTPA